jgi:hypothetical protein
MVGLLGGGVAMAGDPCMKACRAQKRAGLQECVTLTPCYALHKTCKSDCHDQYFGEQLEACVVDCDQMRSDCRAFRQECKDECRLDFLDCKTQCVEQGS